MQSCRAASLPGVRSFGGDNADKPHVPDVGGRGAVGERLLLWGVTQAVRASLLLSPRPAALLIRRVFARTGAQAAAALERDAPTDVSVVVDERYGDGPDMLLDLYRPAGVERPLPLVVWVHGGGFCGGAKHEWSGYYKRLAAAGFAVAAPRYSLAPEHRYPTPVRQVMAALAFLRGDASRLGIDPDRIALAGDSAGAHIAAQVAALVTTPGYADVVGVAPTITAAQLRCAVLCCGPYDLSLARADGSELARRFEQVVLWAYSGKRRFLDDPAFAAASITDHLSGAFPPTLLTVGNADPLRPHSERLAAELSRHGVAHETVFYPSDHQPPLGHEYQFDLDGDAGQRFLHRLLAFLTARLGEG